MADQLQYTMETSEARPYERERLETKEGGYFERLVKDIFDHAGFTTSRDIRIPLTETSVENQEYDVVAESKDAVVLVECKDWEDEVPTKEINIFLGKLYTAKIKSSKPVHGVFAVSQRETPKYAEFRKFLLDKGVSFWDASKIEELQKATHLLQREELYSYVLREIGVEKSFRYETAEVSEFGSYLVRFNFNTVTIDQYVGGKLSPIIVIRAIERKLPSNVSVRYHESEETPFRRFWIKVDFAIKIDNDTQNKPKGIWSLLKGDPAQEKLKSTIRSLEEIIRRVYGIDKDFPNPKNSIRRTEPIKE